MLKRKYCNKISGVYKTPDSVKNLRLRVTLRKLSSLIQIPQYDPDEKADGHHVRHDEETITVWWQEKVLSPAEIERYKDKENCKTDTEKKHHQTIRENDLRTTGRTLFTYVDEDQYVPVDKNSQATEEGSESMYVMADLSPPVVLFTIKHCKENGTLIVYPDFNDITVNPYFLEIDTDSRRMFDYGMQNFSEVHFEDGKEEDHQLVKKFSSLALRPGSSKDFNIPPRRCTYVHVNLQILKAANFDYDNIHVRYKLHLPQQCEIIDANSCSRGSTHSSRKRNGCWSFGHSCEWGLQCSADFNPDDGFSLTFELISIDNWSRERTEGYATFNTKLTPCIVERQLLCQREVSENPWLDRLQRFFIGGRQQFEQIDFDGAANRYGNTTISTGSLDIRLQLVIQRHAEKVHTWNELDDNDSANIPNRSSKVLSTDDILIAYQKARSKLEALTKVIQNG